METISHGGYADSKDNDNPLDEDSKSNSGGDNEQDPPQSESKCLWRAEMTELWRGAPGYTEYSDKPHGCRS